MDTTRKCRYPVPTEIDPRATCGFHATWRTRRRNSQQLCDDHAAVVVDQMGWKVEPIPTQGEHLVKCPHCGLLEVDPRVAQPTCASCGHTGTCAVCGDTVDPTGPYAEVCLDRHCVAELQAWQVADDQLGRGVAYR